MGFARRTLRFGGGLILGAAVGTAVTVLLAPQSGEELKAELEDRMEEAKRAGEEAELLETERLKRAFRVSVSDPLALTGKYDGQRPQLAGAGGDPVAARVIKEREEAQKAEKEAGKAAQDARKAEQDARKAEEQRRKAEEQARKAREKAAKETTEADRAEADAGVKR